MTEGMQIRAQIDSESVKGLLLLNGGGAIALLAFLPTILGKEEFEVLVKFILFGLLLFQSGLVFAVVHNRLRRICSLQYESAYTSSPQDHPKPCKRFGHQFAEPCVCIMSTTFMWASLAMFLLAGLLVFSGGMCVVG